MQIEKVDNNKLKVILSANDLEENNIDLNTFMANSLESQELFLDILDLAEEKFNFYVDNSKLVIESVSLSNNIFIFTITKLSEHKDSTSQNCIYCFENFDQIAGVLPCFNKKNNFNIFTYDNKFYLIINKNDKKNFILDEFSSCKFHSTSLESILIEHGKRE